MYALLASILFLSSLVSAQDNSGDLPPSIIEALANHQDNPELLALLLQNGRYRDTREKPNIVLLVADDMGVGDLSVYGHPTQEPGYIDQFAGESMRFTNAYVGDSVCTPSRSAFMTGRLPVRIGVYGEETRVFLPWTRSGLPEYEVTIAEVLKEAGYATGMVGKWHLGINANTSSDGAHLPYNHGFDFVGHNLPFGNSWNCDDTGLQLDYPNPSVCFLYYNATLMAQPFEHRGISQLFRDDALQFIEENQASPFFLYVAFAHMHTSLFSSDEFTCTSRRGRYGDNLNEMHSSVQAIMESIEEKGIADNTVVFFISDHGPHREYCNEGGDAHIFQGGKSLSWEGGHRVPYLVHWPGTITPGVSHELVTSMDIIATAAELAGSSLPDDREYDGKSIVDVLLNDGSSPHSEFFYYCKDKIMAVRVGKYKAHFRTQKRSTQEEYGERCDEGFPFDDYFECNECDGDCVTVHETPILYDLDKDPGENYPLNVYGHEDILTAVRDAVDRHNAALVKGTPLLDDFDNSRSIVPCCDRSTNCICNFDFQPGVPDCYEDIMKASARHTTFDLD
ncbi:arylsulfatase-like [Diadema antillarum]|uniref:arylsulfatase-like n=1 Tax=Diadema antillarum TaxID=105358 RepID=UPI003A8C455B